MYAPGSSHPTSSALHKLLLWAAIWVDFMIPRQLVTAPAALVASPAADHIQVGSSDVQSSEHVHSGLHTCPNHGICLQLNSCVHLPSRCWTNHSPGQTFPGMLYDLENRLQLREPSDYQQLVRFRCDHESLNKIFTVAEQSNFTNFANNSRSGRRVVVKFANRKHAILMLMWITIRSRIF